MQDFDPARLEILQIITAEGWLAKHRDGNGRLFLTPVSCWALARDPDTASTGVMGLGHAASEPHGRPGHWGFLENLPGFEGYGYDPERAREPHLADEAFANPYYR
ncbi:hypothetical protein [Thiohalorhabdus methylotrophus]|uniref:Uncharacterized protein n=1 Tax=Thiohalorhabdus methylotrophus TaxID=3242694 RepID=A0ABV4TUI6_9GAMM